MQDVAAENITVDICVYAFDLLYLNGEVHLVFCFQPFEDEDVCFGCAQSLLREPFAVRRQKLYDNFQEVPHEFLFAKHKDRWLDSAFQKN